jgi:hypothetical protein
MVINLQFLQMAQNFSRSLLRCNLNEIEKQQETTTHNTTEMMNVVLCYLMESIHPVSYYHQCTAQNLKHKSYT